MKGIRRIVKGLSRGFGIAGVCIAGFSEYFARILPQGKAKDRITLARWTQGISLRFLKVLDIEISTAGPKPKPGMLACNHLSYLDIVVLAALHPSTFVSKYQVKHWPIFGWFGVLSGTLFLRRERKAHAVEVAQQFGEVIESGALLTLFPEGTSTDGSHVRPFHSTLFEPAAKNDWAVTPAWISYSVAEGSVEKEICFIDDMLFLPHFLNLLMREDGASAKVVMGEPVSPNLNRKEIAAGLHNQVCRLAAENSGCERRSNPQVEWDDNALDQAAVSLG